ncbi:MAG: hypothetical protein HXY51_13145 [Nitrospirae bacterium]|nr:hypothetical protein [Nitrospirota bacterium]
MAKKGGKLEGLHPPDYAIMTHWPAGAPVGKSQFAVTHGEDAITDRRLILVIGDANAEPLSRSDLMSVILDGGCDAATSKPRFGRMSARRVRSFQRPGGAGPGGRGSKCVESTIRRAGDIGKDLSAGPS